MTQDNQEIQNIINNGLTIYARFMEGVSIDNIAKNYQCDHLIIEAIIRLVCICFDQSSDEE